MSRNLNDVNVPNCATNNCSSVYDQRGVNPISLNNNSNFGFNKFTRLEYDNCAYTKEEIESKFPGEYQLSGFDPKCCNKNEEFLNRANEIMQFQKQYCDTLCNPKGENELRYTPLTNLREINQLFARPYLGHFEGAGTRSIDKKNVESFLMQGLTTTRKDTETSRGKDVYGYRFNYLPCWGNPQRTEVSIEPPLNIGGWVRGGSHTRDYVRRIDHQKQYLNKVNNQLVNKN